MHETNLGRAEIIHLQVGAKKLAFEDRIAHLEDPAFGDPKISLLISKEYAARRRQKIEESSQPRQSSMAQAASDTTFLCAADRDGNAIALIQSIFAGFGSRVIAGDSGVIMNNRLCSFGLDPSKANALVPGKRPAHTLNTYMVFRDGEFFAAGGTPGADDQPQTNLQVLHNLLDLGMDPQSAVEAPRWSHQPGTPPRDKLPEELRVEEGVDQAVIEALGKKGHKVSIVDRWSFGSAKVIVRDPETGTLMAGADPRREAYALGY
jgi:gamma-glutamyltranspeptidase/glutathione hydrolase